MDLYIYSDESGVFDKVHNDIFVFGGIIFLNKESVEIAERKYHGVEKIIRVKSGCDRKQELKACKITNAEKAKIFRSLNKYIKFGVIKKTKQRYLDYAYKIGLKKCLQKLIQQGIISKDNISNIYVYADEHTTATNGRYELREALEQEFKHGTFNYDYNTFFPPLFSNMNGVNVQYCNSSKKTLIRAADIVANRIYYEACNGNLDKIKSKIYLHTLP